MDDRQLIIRLHETVKAAQLALRDYVLPGGISQREMIDRLTQILEDDRLLELQRVLEGGGSTSDERRRGPEDPLPYR